MFYICIIVLIIFIITTYQVDILPNDFLFEFVLNLLLKPIRWSNQL